MMLRLVVALVLLLLAARAQPSAPITLQPSQLDPGARCEPFPVVSANCQGVVPVGSLIYFNSTQSFGTAQARATLDSAKISIVRNAAHSSECADYLTRWIPCTWLNFTSANGTESYALPNYTCQGFCDEVNTVCLQIALNYGQPNQTCDVPTTYDFTSIGGEAVAPNCSTGWSLTSSCPTTCLRPDYQDVDNCCNIRCPLGKPLFGKKRYEALVTTTNVLGWIALVSTTIVTLLFALNPVARAFPGVLIIVQGVALIFESFGTVMTSFYGVESLQCNPDHYVACNFQGAFVALGAQLSLTYWLVLNAYTFVSLYAPNPRKWQRWVRRYHWTLAVFVIYPVLSLALSAWWSAEHDPSKPADHRGSFYGRGVFPTCLSGFEAVRNYYVIWSLILIGLGTIMWFGAMYKIASITFYARKHGSGGLQLRMHLAIILYQVLVFCTAGLFCVLFLVLYRYFGGQHPEFTDQLVAYISGQTDTPPDDHFGLFFALGFIISFVALFYSIVFGIRSIHWTFLRKKFVNITSAMSSTTKKTGSATDDMWTLEKGDEDEYGTSHF